MKKPYYVFIPGIFGEPESPSEWIDKAESYIEMNCDANATTLPYHTDAVFRRMGQEERVDNLCIMLDRIDSRPIILVAHSNGCDIVERLIKRKRFNLEQIHLIAAASENDFKKNGYNQALKDGTVKKIFVYWSKKDKALHKAKWSSYLFSWLGLGYGFLGLTGPKNVPKTLLYKVASLHYELDHSEYFNCDNFTKLMKRITGK